MRFECISHKVSDYGNGLKAVDVVVLGQESSQDDESSSPFTLLAASSFFVKTNDTDSCFKEGQRFFIDIAPGPNE